MNDWGESDVHETTNLLMVSGPEHVIQIHVLGIELNVPSRQSDLLLVFLLSHTPTHPQYLTSSFTVHDVRDYQPATLGNG